MLRVQILAVGKLKEDYLKQACAEYVKRLSRYIQLSVVEIAEGTVDFEGEEILKRVKGKLVALDIGGEMLTSVQLAQRVQDWKMQSSDVTLVIGGSNGISAKVQSKASELISFSPLTFPHQLFRVLLLEQLYRAETILAKTPYHK